MGSASVGRFTELSGEPHKVKHGTAISTSVHAPGLRGRRVFLSKVIKSYPNNSVNLLPWKERWTFTLAFISQNKGKNVNTVTVSRIIKA